MTSPRGIRNRNPGNIIVSGWTVRQTGYVGPEPEGRFARFDTMAHGVQALLALLMNYRKQGLITVRQIINKWAPPVENDTGSYVVAVAKVLGVGLDEELPHDAATYIRLAKAIAGHENGREAASAITEQDYADAASAIFGVERVTPGSPPEEESPPLSTPQPTPAPLKEKIMASPATILALGAELINLIPWVKKNKEVADKVIPRLMDVAREVVPEGNEQAKVEAIKTNPQLQERFVAKATAQWSDIAPMLEFEARERQAARDADVAFASGKARLRDSPSFIIAVMLIPLIYVAVVSVSLKLPFFPDWPNEIRIAVISSTVGIIIGSLTGYYYGYMTSSNRK